MWDLYVGVFNPYYSRQKCVMKLIYHAVLYSFFFVENKKWASVMDLFYIRWFYIIYYVKLIKILNEWSSFRLKLAAGNQENSL